MIIYIIHEKIGHLGIFVSGSVAKKEHTGIIGNFDLIEYLAPGLYEMTINEEAGRLGQTDFEPRLQRRTIREMLAQVGGVETDTGEEGGDFRRVSDLSQINDKLYQAFVQPWIRLWSSEFTGELFRMLHPMRMQRYMLSDVNPCQLAVEFHRPLRRQEPLPRPAGQPVRSNGEDHIRRH